MKKKYGMNIEIGIQLLNIYCNKYEKIKEAYESYLKIAKLESNESNTPYYINNRHIVPVKIEFKQFLHLISVDKEFRERYTSHSTPALAGYISTILSENRGMSPEELKQHVFSLATRRNIITRDFILEPDNSPNYGETHEFEISDAYVLNIQ